MLSFVLGSERITSSDLREIVTSLEIHMTQSPYTLLRSIYGWSFVRKFLDDMSMKLPGDPTKAAVRIVEFVDAGNEGEDLPFRWMMGKDCIASVRTKIASLTDSADKSEKWSDDLQLGSA